MSFNLPDINIYKTRIDIIKDVARQIEKDLNVDIPLKLSGNPNEAYQELYDQTFPRIKETANRALFSFKQLLYKIDVSEKKLTDAFRENIEMDEFEIYTHLIIERELQKVATRLLFKSTIDK